MQRKTKQQIIDAILILAITLAFAFASTGCAPSTERVFAVPYYTDNAAIVDELVGQIAHLQSDLQYLKVDTETEQQELEARIASLASEIAALEALVEDLKLRKKDK